MDNSSMYIVFNADRLILCHEKLSVSVDFLSVANRYRWRRATISSELLAKAVGMKADYRPVVVDATAGFGLDSFLLASLGCQVTLFERSFFLYQLLCDGFTRAVRSDMALVASRMQIVYGNSVHYLQQLENKQDVSLPDVIYLDPMFSPKRKKALAKKEMQLLQLLLPLDDDNNKALLQVALNLAVKRVVVKRARLAEPLAGCSPSFSLYGRSNRFDVYV